MALNLYNYKATILKIVDGDTIDVEVDLGFDVFRRERLRLKDVYAAEMREPLGKEHKQILTDLIPVGAEVILATEKDKKDKYGRFVATIFLTDGQNVNSLAQEKFGNKFGRGL